MGSGQVTVNGIEPTTIHHDLMLEYVSSVLRDEKGMWRRRLNFELYQSYKESDIVNLFKIQRIEWTGHFVRMDEDHFTKKSLQCPTNRHTKKGQVVPQWWRDFDVGGSTFHFYGTRRCTRVTDLNFVDQSAHYTSCGGVRIFTNKMSVTSLSSSITE
ncbi:hypothetical protein TNCV_2007411 [Trichonephila clavipes]|nr:hypothetical protein TNCV_2007411 [Trichonephila clavipes]